LNTTLEETLTREDIREHSIHIHIQGFVGK